MHPKTPIRRTHTPEFKAEVLAACRQPGASIAAVAISHGLNANLVHKWLAGIGLKRCSQVARVETAPPAQPMQFLPVGLLPAGSEQAGADIRLSLDLGALQVKLNCNRAAAASHATALRALAEMVTRA